MAKRTIKDFFVPILAKERKVETSETNAECREEDKSIKEDVRAEMSDVVSSSKKSLKDSSEETSCSGSGSSNMFENRPYHPFNISPQIINGRKFYFQTKLYREYPWLHYNSSIEGFSCYYCCKALKKGLFRQKYDEVVKVSDLVNGRGFRKWNKANEKLTSHECSPLHKDAVTILGGLESVPICSVLSSAKNEQQKCARVALRAMINSLRFLARQGIPLRGHYKESGNVYQLNQLRNDETPQLEQFLKRKKDFSSDVIQNEILQIMAHCVLREIISEVRENKLFSLIVDETCDISCKEQVSISVRTVNDLEVRECFLGLYETSNTTGSALHDIIIDGLQRFNLPLEHLRGQCYDGGANMSGVRKGVQALIKQKQPLALFVHCNNHNLNLALQDTTRTIPLLRDTMNLINDIGVFLKDSPKRISQFKDIKAAEGVSEFTSPRPLCPTRWSVRTSALHAIVENYSALLAFFENISSAPSDSSSKARGLLDNLMKGSTVFGILLCQLIFAPTEKLSISLQKSSQTVIGSREAVEVVLNHLKGKRNDETFQKIWNNVHQLIEDYDLLPPLLPRVRCPPKRLEHSEKPAEPHRWSSVEDMYKTVFFEALDNICGEISYRFDQPDFKTYCELENLVLLSPENWKQSMITEAEKRGIPATKLKLEMEMFSRLSKIRGIHQVVAKFRSLHKETRNLFPLIEALLKELLVIPATSATAERSFSTLKRIKTYLRSTMSQERLNHLCVLHAYQHHLDNLDLAVLMKEFVNNEYRKSVFGKV